MHLEWLKQAVNAYTFALILGGALTGAHGLAQQDH